MSGWKEQELLLLLKEKNRGATRQFLSHLQKLRERNDTTPDLDDVWLVEDPDEYIQTPAPKKMRLQ